MSGEDVESCVKAKKGDVATPTPCVHMCNALCVWGASVFSFYHVGSMYQTQVSRLGSKCPFFC